MDADRRREDQPAARRTDDVAREGQDQGDDDDAVEQALDEPQERQLEQEEADVAAEDRIGDARGRRERDAVEVEQDRLPRPGQRPADEERDEQGDPAEDPAGERREIGHVPDFEGDGLAVPVPVAAGTEPRNAAPPRRSSAAWAASLMRPTSDRSEPAPSAEGGGASRPASHRLPRKTAAAMTNAADAQAERRDHPRPEDGVEPDTAEPQRIGPQVDADAEQQEDGDDRGHDDVEPDPPAGARSPAGTAVVGAAGSAPGGRRPPPRRASSNDRGGCRCRLSSVRVVAGSASVSSVGVASASASASVVAVGVVGVVRVASRSRDRGGTGVLAARCRFASPEFFHEIVE